MPVPPPRLGTRQGATLPPVSRPGLRTPETPPPNATHPAFSCIASPPHEGVPAGPRPTPGSGAAGELRYRIGKKTAPLREKIDRPGHRTPETSPVSLRRTNGPRWHPIGTLQAVLRGFLRWYETVNAWKKTNHTKLRLRMQALFRIDVLI